MKQPARSYHQLLQLLHGLRDFHRQKFFFEKGHEYPLYLSFVRFHETDDYHEVFHIQLKPYILFTDVGLGLPMTLLRTRVASSLVLKDIFIAVCTYQMRKSEKCRAFLDSFLQFFFCKRTRLKP